MSESVRAVTEFVALSGFFATGAMTMYYRWRAIGRRRPGARPFRIEVWPSPDDRADFSEAGWRDRNRAICCQLMGIGFMFLWWLSMPQP